MQFETTRAKLLPIPNLDGLVNYVEWAEETDPYAAALSTFQAATPQAGRLGTRKIFVDNSIRKFIVDGLYHASQSETKPRSQFSRLQFENQNLHNIDPAHHHGREPLQISSAPHEVTQMRERKSEAELQILQCVNEVSIHIHCVSPSDQGFSYYSLRIRPLFLCVSPYFPFYSESPKWVKEDW